MYRTSLILMLFLCCSCAVYSQPPRLHDGSGIKVKYEQRIKDWQKRIKREGWSEKLVDEIVQTVQVFAQYTPDKNPSNRGEADYWFTPKEMIAADFKGDCEDIGSLTYGTLKGLRYPHGVRLLIVSTLLPIDHILVRVELPGGKWKNYETVNVLFSEIDGIFYQPLLEFDENHIWIYDPSRKEKKI